MAFERPRYPRPTVVAAHDTEFGFRAGATVEQIYRPAFAFVEPAAAAEYFRRLVARLGAAYGLDVCGAAQLARKNLQQHALALRATDHGAAHAAYLHFYSGETPFRAEPRRGGLAAA